MQTQLKCDNNARLVTGKHRQAKKLCRQSASAVTQVVCVTPFRLCLLPQLGQIDAFDTEQDVSGYLKTKHDTGTTHYIQMAPATQSTLHVMLFVSHARACGVDFGRYGLTV